MTKQLTAYLEDFGAVAELFHVWSLRRLMADPWAEILESFPKRPATAIAERVGRSWKPTVYTAYNAATYHATHRMRSANGAFKLLKLTNRGFQKHFPVDLKASADPNQGRLVLDSNGTPPSNGR